MHSGFQKLYSSASKKRLTSALRFNAFTLAEVLITLGIIGVVAAMTIPILIQNSQEQEYKTAYRKAYSVLSQSLLYAKNDNSLVALIYSAGTTQGAEEDFAALKQSFSVVTDCTASNTSDCWASGETFRSEVVAAPAFVDKSGVGWKMNRTNAQANAAYILVDTNGLKKPNQYGKDRFPFIFRVTDVDGVDGVPVKIGFIGDAITTDALTLTFCPSAAKNPCYYTSWLIGG